MNLPLHANGKKDHLADLTAAAAQEIEAINSNASLSNDEREDQVKAIRERLTQERKSAWSKLF